MVDPALQRARELYAAEAQCRDTKRAIMDGAWDDTRAMAALAKREREFSDAVEAYHMCPYTETMDALRAFILPKPKPDPLAKAWTAAFGPAGDVRAMEQLRSALTATGSHITEIEP